MALAPLDRTRIITEFARKLAQEPWSILDLTLREFGFRTQDSWSGSKIDYIVEMATGATDDQLRAAATLVDYQVPTAGVVAHRTPENPVESHRLWKPRTLRIFISHLATHRQYAAEIQAHLGKFGISSFVAHNDIAPNLVWVEEIEEALRTCDAIVALLHSGFHASNWTDQELGYGMGRGIPIYSVRLGEDPYGFISRFQAFSGIGRTAQDVASALATAYNRDPLTYRKQLDAILSQLESTDSWESCRKTISVLEGFSRGDADYAPRLLAAVIDNPKVKDTWNAEERLATLHRKWTS